MRKLGGKSLVILMGVIALNGCSRLQKTGHFGEPFSDAPVVSIAQLLENPAGYTRKTIRISGLIERQCPAAGCWVVLKHGAGKGLRVEMGDTLPKLPINIGNYAEVEGELIMHGNKPLFIGTKVTFTRTGQ